MFPLPRLLGVEAMQRLVLRLCSQAKEGRYSASAFLHGSLVMEIFIMPKELVGKRIAP